MIFVKVVMMGRKVETVTLDNGKTVEDALKAADFLPIPSGYQVRRKNEIVEMDDRVADGDLITLVSKVKAG